MGGWATYTGDQPGAPRTCPCLTMSPDTHMTLFGEESASWVPRPNLFLDIV